MLNATASGTSDAGSRFVAVSVERHQSFRWRKFTSYAFVQDHPVIPIVLGEHEQIAATLPLQFSRTQTGFVPVALTRLGERTALVAPNGAWRGSYVPSLLRVHPFSARKLGQNQFELTVDESSETVSEGADGEPFFQPDGTLAPGLTEVVDFFRQRTQAEEKTIDALSVIARCNLLKPCAPWSGAASHLQGLFEPDRERLDKLTRGDLSLLHRSGGLALLHASLISRNHMVFFAHAEAQLEQKGELDSTAYASPDDSIADFLNAVALANAKDMGPD